jgi:hypothetical protein
MAAGDDQDDRRQRHLAVLEGERLDVAGQVMHRNERQPARPRQRLGEGDADQQ